jgi:hypothetical protein
MNRSGRAIGVGLVAGWLVGGSTEGHRAAMLEQASATTRSVDRG